MIDEHDKKISASLKKLASELRNSAVEREEWATIKSAQAVVAANGLYQLRKIMKGVV